MSVRSSNRGSIGVFGKPERHITGSSSITVTIRSWLDGNSGTDHQVSVRRPGERLAMTDYCAYIATHCKALNSMIFTCLFSIFSRVFEDTVLWCGKEPTVENIRKWVKEIGDVLHLKLLYSPLLHQKLATQTTIALSKRRREVTIGRYIAVWLGTFRMTTVMLLLSPFNNKWQSLQYK